MEYIYIHMYIQVPLHIDVYAYIYDSSKKVTIGKIFPSSIFLWKTSKTKQNHDRKYRADYENQYRMFARLVWIIGIRDWQRTWY